MHMEVGQIGIYRLDENPRNVDDASMSKNSAATVFPTCQANDWFYVYTGPTGEKAVDRVVMWARLLDDANPAGAIVGLLSVRHDAGGPAALVLPSTSEGCYVHADDLSDTEKLLLYRYRNVMNTKTTSL